jgi:hypothetical protein
MLLCRALASLRKINGLSSGQGPICERDNRTSKDINVERWKVLVQFDGATLGSCSVIFLGGEVLVL